MLTPLILRKYKGAIRELRYFYSSFGLKGLIAEMGAKINRKSGLYEVNRQGVLFPFYLRLGTSDIKTFEQVFVQNYYDFAPQQTPRVIIDAGANIGLASIVFANRYPDSRIIAIEPEIFNFEMLQRNVASYQNIISLHAALWDTNEKINLVDPGFGEWGFRTQKNSSEGVDHFNHLYEVQGLTVDRIMDDFGLETIDILKIDIEGAEREVFLDPSLWIDRVNMLIVELHERFKEGCSQSFYNGTSGFDSKWKQGGNHFASRRDRGLVL